MDGELKTKLELVSTNYVAVLDELKEIAELLKGDEGILMRVDRNTRFRRSCTKWFTVTWSAITGLAIKITYDTLKHN